MWEKSIQTAGYNGARTIIVIQDIHHTKYNVWIFIFEEVTFFMRIKIIGVSL